MIDIGFQFVPLMKPVIDEFALIGKLVCCSLSLPYLIAKPYFETNVFSKSVETACDHVLRSALIQLQNTAKAKGANAVTNIVSYFKSNESKSSTTYQCFKGTAVASVALKGDLVKF